LKGELHVLNPSGHTAVEFDSEVEDGTKQANDEFDKLIAQGFLGYGTTEAGESEQLKEFSSEYPKVTVTPPLAGG
jgi:hypothetical protein